MDNLTDSQSSPQTSLKSTLISCILLNTPKSSCSLNCYYNINTTILLYFCFPFAPLFVLSRCKIFTRWMVQLHVERSIIGIIWRVQLVQILGEVQQPQSIQRLRVQMHHFHFCITSQDCTKLKNLFCQAVMHRSESFSRQAMFGRWVVEEQWQWKPN